MPQQRRLQNRNETKKKKRVEAVYVLAQRPQRCIYVASVNALVQCFFCFDSSVVTTVTHRRRPSWPNDKRHHFRSLVRLQSSKHRGPLLRKMCRVLAFHGFAWLCMPKFYYVRASFNVNTRKSVTGSRSRRHPKKNFFFTIPCTCESNVKYFIEDNMEPSGCEQTRATEQAIIFEIRTKP